MRIVNREKFLKLPSGTVYAKIPTEWIVGEICVKYESLNDDWFYRGFSWVDAKDSGEATDRLEEMKHKAISYPVEKSIQRDGFFDKEDQFLIYEKEDVKKIIEALSGSLV